MAQHKVVFAPLQTAVTVAAGTTLLEAAGKARITIDSVCGGDGICGRCKMIVKEGKVGGRSTALLTREEIRHGVVLACQTAVQSDMLVEIPEETRAREEIVIDKDAQRFRADHPALKPRDFGRAPLVTKLFMKLAAPTSQDNLADCQRLQAQVEKLTGISSMQTGLKIIQRLPNVLRDNDFAVTATIGRRRDIAEIMDIEGGNTSGRNFIAAVDIGTSTIVVHLMNAIDGSTVDTQACFNSQAIYGREVTTRMMAAERSRHERLQQLLV